ncbi:MAG: rhombotarget lipoprotein [Desulfuromonadales bacterium]|nr:rhombotarget lipoprotein [Desulfuromonadales bacterium]MBN2793499.1 rhombotarget lipoprotein [Desulfuromonadales bacterium]
MKRLIFILCVALLVSGCAGKRHYSSSLMDYLYPNSQREVIPSMPTLDVPLKVGIAFVPNQSIRGDGSFWSWSGQRPHAVPISEKERMELMAGVAREFEQQDFISSIELIPSGYLTASGGFDNLEQIRTMYGLDVIALLSYDQVQNTDEGFMSLSYWTIIGAYMVRGEKNSTNTLLDAAVFHIPSKSLLFRAPGTSFVKGKATPVNLDEQLRKDAAEGLQLASAQMIDNLKIQLDLFKQKVKEQPEKYQVTYRPGSSYGGSIQTWLSLVMVAVGVFAGVSGWRRRK